MGFLTPAALLDTPRLPLVGAPTPVEELPKLRQALGGGPELFVKRDDAIALGGGGSKVRKLEFVLQRAIESGADIVVTTGGVQSNHARVTAAAAARLGMGCHLVLSGEPPAQARGNLRLAQMFGASVEFVSTRAEREAGMSAASRRFEREGRRPFVIPLGASTAEGALGLVRAVWELSAQMQAPDVIVHSTSSGGTQAGLVAGCLVAGLPTRVIGISADDDATTIRRTVLALIREVRTITGTSDDLVAADTRVEVDDAFVGGGYGIPTDASVDAQRLAARLEALILDPTYTAKAMAALIAYVRDGRFTSNQRILFWHTGGVPAIHT